MSRNEEGSEMEWICSWVPYAIYEREREREREGKGEKQKTQSKQSTNNRKEKVCMHEKCMRM